MKNDYIKIAKIVAAHGIKGQNKIQISLDNVDYINKIAQFYDELEQNLEFKIHSLLKNIAIVKFTNVDNRNAAEAIIGRFIYIKKDDLPELDNNNYYYDDLISMEVVDIDRNIIGTIINLYNYGAGDIVEIEFNNKQKELFPFVDEYFPEIDLKIRKVLFIRPQYI